jgi:peptide/nickel transport system substrate-binding protein
MQKFAIVLVAALAICGGAGTSYGKPLRWTSQGDVLTMDPHSQNESFTNGMNGQVYEPLVSYDKQLRLVPGLAVSWTNPEPTVWRFKLRPGVKFHDGAAFTADDVVFSLERANQPSSNFRVYAATVKHAKKIDDLTVEVVTRGPNPVFLQQMSLLYIMNKAWCVKNKADKPQNFTEKEESFSARNANGTGPYILKTREPDVKTILVENPKYWGKREGNVTEMIYLPIKSDATRVAALLSGEVDFVLDPPPQDIARLKANPAIKVIEGAENRIIFFGMDQQRDELLYSNVKGRNPFKDVRVRQAMSLAIDIEAIKSRTMRGLAIPAGTMALPQADGYTAELDRRAPVDPAKAKKLLADAGYPTGFEITLDCPNNRYVNDEEICQAAAAMFSKIGVTTRLNAMPRAVYFPKLQKGDTSMYMLGWGGQTTDAIFTLRPVMHSPRGGQEGSFNYGRYTNVRLDELIDRIDVEMDQPKRRAMVTEALKLHADEMLHIPLHRQMIPWAMRSNVKVVHRADNRLEGIWVEIN